MANIEMREAQKLALAVRNWSDDPLKKFRKVRKEALIKFGGALFGTTQKEERQLLPLYYAFTSIFLPQLYVKPDPLVTAHNPALRRFAILTEKAIEFVLEEIRYSETLRTVILDALYGRGITVSGIGGEPASGLTEPEGYLADPGRPFVRQVLEEDFIEDTAATRPDAVAFRGHRFLLPFDYAMDCGLYDRKGIEELHEKEKGFMKKRGLEEGQNTHERFLDEIELMTLWLPRDGRLVTLPGNTNLAKDYLREDDYDGPEEGPYNILSFMTAPGSITPVPPMVMLWGLQQLLNRIGGKVARQALSQKKLLVARPGSEKEAQAALDAETDSVITGDPQAVNTVEMGGVSETNYRAAMWFYEFLNRTSGNPNVIGGTEAQAPTLGQEQMIFGAASSIQSDRRARVSEFAGRDCRNIAWRLWNDTGPLGRVMNMVQRIPFIGDIPIKWTPDKREGDFADYVFKIRSHAAADDSPESRYRQIVRWIGNIVVPLAQIGASQGKVPDVGLLTELTGRYLGIDEAEEIFTIGMPSEAPAVRMPGGEAEGPAQRPGTATREAPSALPSQPPAGKGAQGS